MKLTEPVIIIGAARSGTTMLAELLATHPDVAYWVEPKYIWRYGNPHARSDVRTAEEATPEVIGYIRRKFARFLERSGKQKFMEKTPSNCFRLDFIHKVLPDARIVVIHRDGRDVVRSAVKKWTSPPDRTAILRRLRTLEIPRSELGHYATDFIRDVIGRQLNPGSGYIWGPHFPGISEVRKRMTIEETCAIQWAESVKAIRRGLTNFAEGMYLEVRYEDILAQPELLFKEIMTFCGLSHHEGVLENVINTVRPIDDNPGSSFTETDSVNRLLYEELEKLGYDVTTPENYE